MMWRTLKSTISGWVGSKRFDTGSNVHITITNPYHAVSIIASSGACELARRASGRRFLSSEAPRLPLRGCPLEGACRCSYRHHDDRRRKMRRAAERLTALPASRTPWSGDERRRSRGRRTTDLL